MTDNVSQCPVGFISEQFKRDISVTFGTDTKMYIKVMRSAGVSVNLL